MRFDPPSRAIAIAGVVLAVASGSTNLRGHRSLKRKPKTTLFAQSIGHLVDTRLDPLVNPGTCSGHVHSVLGNARFGSRVKSRWYKDDAWRDDTEDKVDRTTSELVPNLSSYWVPSLYVWHNETGQHHLVPSFARTYYRIEHTQSDDTRLTVNPFPDFLRMIVGDASRKEAWRKDETDRDNIRWTLTTQNRKTTDYLNNGDWSYLDKAAITAYDRGQIEMLAKFPSCLAVNGRGRPVKSSSNFRDHAAYATSDTWDDKRGWCPPNHPYPVPRLDLEMRYDLGPVRRLLGDDVVNDPANWRLSSGDASGAGGHADFISGWPADMMKNIIANCTDGESDDGRDCFLDGMDLDGRDGRGKRVPYSEEIPNERVHKVSTLPGQNGEGCPEMVPADNLFVLDRR